MGPQDVLYAWRDFECSSFAAALMCPRAPFRRFLIREAHSVEAGARLGVTSAVMMRRMTSVSPYRHWHFFDAYRTGIPARGVSRQWHSAALGQHERGSRSVPALGGVPDAAQSGHRCREGGAQAEIADLDHAGWRTTPGLYCCHSMLTRDAAAVSHVSRSGVDLSPALSAQGYDESALVQSVAEACRKGGGDAPIPAEARQALRTVSKVLNIGWIGDALSHDATTICSRSNRCPRSAQACH